MLLASVQATLDIQKDHSHGYTKLSKVAVEPKVMQWSFGQPVTAGGLHPVISCGKQCPRLLDALCLAPAKMKCEIYSHSSQQAAGELWTLQVIIRVRRDASSLRPLTQDF